MSALEQERALTLQEVAEILGMSYGTVFAKRHEIGFQLPGSRIWRVWPSNLKNFSKHKKEYNPKVISLRVATLDGGNNICQSVKSVKSGGSIYARQTAKELDDLLGP